MTSPQRALVRYWVTGLAALAVTLILYSYQRSLLFLLPALIVIAVVDRTMRPARPEKVPTPLEIVESNPTWKWFVIGFGIAAALTAVLAVTFHDLGSWLSQNEWLLLSILIPILGPLIQSEVAVYKAHGEREP